MDLRQLCYAMKYPFSGFHGLTAKFLISIKAFCSSLFVKRIEQRSSAWKNKKSKVKYWPQYAEEFYKPVQRKPLADMPADDSFKIVFTGNIGYAQGLDILPKAAAILKRNRINCSFIIIGDGRYKGELEREIALTGVKDMFYLLGRKKPEEIPDYLAWCDVAFISFADNPLFAMTIPAKLQSYMACGMPILASASGETERIIKEAECGMVCRIGDAERLAERVKNLCQMQKDALEKMGQNAFRYCRDEFGRIDLLNKISRYLDR